MKIRKRTPTASAKELTPLEQLFAKEYLKDFNACAALRRCDSKKRTYPMERKLAAQLVARGRVQDFIQKEFAARTAKIEVDVEFVLKELLQIANCDIAEAFNPNGTLKPIHDIPTPVRKSIAGFDTEDVFKWEPKDGKKGQDKVWVGTLKKVKFWDKKGSLELLGKYLAMFVERQRIEDPNGQPLPAVQVHVHKHEARPIAAQETLANDRTVVAEPAPA